MADAQAADRIGHTGGVSASHHPVILVADDDPKALARTEAELRRRYGEDYQVACECDTTSATGQLERLRGEHQDVAVVLADVWMAERPGSDVLARARDLHPHAKRALLIDWGAWGDRPTAAAILHAMAKGQADYYVLKPSRTGEEQFHRAISEFLHEWSREHAESSFELAIIAEPTSPRTHEIRDLLRRSGVPHAFCAPDSELGEELLAGIDQDSAGRPVVRLRGDKVLVDPTNEEIVRAFGVNTEPVQDNDFDLVIVGAGPAGLSAAVYARSEGLRTLVIERETIGGQAGSSSLIRNYLGFARGVTGAELAQRAYQQAWVFGVEFAVSRDVVALQLAEEPYGVLCDHGYIARGKAILLATGVSYARIGIPGLEALSGAGVYYGASTVEGLGLGSEDVYVVGGGNSAGQAALHLARSAARVQLLVRGHDLAEDMSAYLRETIDATPNVHVRTRTEVADGGGNARLEWLEIRDHTSGETRRVDATALFILIGAQPHTSWLPEEISLAPNGHILTGTDAGACEHWPLERPPTPYETSVPGVFAVGDARQGAVKRVASAVGEASVAIPDVHAWLAAAGRVAERG
jgi:thioredoxin reductase (NADPH)